MAGRWSCESNIDLMLVMVAVACLGKQVRPIEMGDNGKDWAVRSMVAVFGGRVPGCVECGGCLESSPSLSLSVASPPYPWP